MGRHKGAEYKPFQATAGSDWRWWNPITKKQESLGTKIWEEAWKLSRQILDMDGGQAAKPEGATVNDTPPAGSAPKSPVADLLSDWSTSKGPLDDVPAPAVADPTPKPSPLPVQPPKPVAMVPASTPTPKKGMLTPEQASKMARGVRNMVCRLNVVAIEGCVNFLGRDPFPVDDDDLELMALGWELWLDEFFVKHKPKPWMLILAGNVMLFASAYIRGTDKPKKPAPDHIEVTEDVPPGFATRQ